MLIHYLHYVEITKNYPFNEFIHLSNIYLGRFHCIYHTNRKSKKITA